MRKIFFLFLPLVLTASCLHSKMGEPKVNPMDSFDWKTTKSVPVNITSEDGDGVPVFIYNENKIVAAGYTPFTNKINVPKSCAKLTITTLPLASALTKSAVDDKYTKEVGVVDGVYVNAKVSSSTHIDLHKYLYTQWAGWRLGGHTWEVFVGWWNTSGGAQGQSTITIYSDHKPEYNTDNSIKFIYHTCNWDECSDGEPGGEEQPVQFATRGTYIFEDLFPSLGDFDMNDCVVEEKTKAMIGKHNTVESCEITLKINALGAGAKIGLAVFMPKIVKQRVKKDIKMWIVDSDGKDTPYYYNGKSFAMANKENGLEDGQTDLVIPISDDLMSLVVGVGGGAFFNTKDDGRKGEPITIKIEVEFNSNQISYEEFKTDVFVLGSGLRGNEIHVADASFTDKMNRSLFKTGQDNTNLEIGKTYRAKNGYVWGIFIPEETFRHAKEKVNLSEAYSEFNGWVTSGGSTNQNWYKNPTSDKTWSWDK